jgi:hypothetical protein
MNDTLTSADGSTDFPKTRAIAYIDGFNLYYGLKKASEEADRLHLENGGPVDACLGRSLYWLDIQAVISGQLHPSETLVGVNYYSAPRRVPKRVPPTAEVRAEVKASNERQGKYLDALRTLPLVDVRLGFYSEKSPHRCKQCGSQWARFEEKCTDVNIATDMVGDAYENRFDLAIVISADADLVAPIVAVQKLGKAVRLLLPPGQVFAKYLSKVVDEPRTIKISNLRGLTLPPVIERSENNLPPLKCPDQWKATGAWVWKESAPTLEVSASAATKG